ncbi:hypothetical protein ACTJJN_26770, partial [Pseudomonas sp. 22515]|uniref:hypothetical protein n=1 Tax=unclassified Pseudomonas TaxID=196821 RepID=UPI002D1888C3
MAVASAPVPAPAPAFALALALALALAFALAFASKRAVVQAMQIATSGGRAQGLRREVTGMDARQAL